MSEFTELVREYVDALGRLGVLRAEVDRQLERRQIAEKNWRAVESKLIDLIEKVGNPCACDLGDGRAMVMIGSPYKVHMLPLENFGPSPAMTSG